ncbi:MAG: ATP-binding protein [Candidatus Odinarchaeota archaeon]
MDYPSRRKSKMGTIKIGKIISKNKSKHNFFLNISDLAQHMFVCGITGTGKSNLIQYFLLNFTKHHDLPFLLTEFKGEYQFLQRNIQELLIIKPGENFSINIFDPEGADPEVHAERVFEIFESGGLLEGVEYSPQMERVFVDILNEVCPKPGNRNWEAFKQISNRYGATNNDLMYKKSVTAVQNRIRRYSLGTLKNIFVKKSGLEVKELFKHKVLLDLSSIIRLGGEKEDALFFLNMILKYLWDKNIGIGSKNYEGIKHITIIEDAQYFAPEELSSRTKLSSYLEDIALLLRGTGECLVSLATRPKISKEILANCGVFVSFQNHMQKDIMQELLNLEEEQKEYLSMLQKGQCIIRVNSIEKPFFLKTPYIERSWLSDDEIMENNRKIIEKNEPPPEKMKICCELCGKELDNDSDYCNHCSTSLTNEDKAIEDFQKLINKLYKEQQNKKKR